MPQPYVVLKITRMKYFFLKIYNVLNIFYILLCCSLFRLAIILLYECRVLKVFYRAFALAV